jgi:hypothetical protein
MFSKLRSGFKFLLKFSFDTRKKKKLDPSEIEIENELEEK